MVMQWLINNLGTIVVLIILLVIVVLALRSVIRQKQCGRPCTGCPSARSCPHCKTDPPFNS